MTQGYSSLAKVFFIRKQKWMPLLVTLEFNVQPTFFIFAPL